jgi:hypothetical protein
MRFHSVDYRKDRHGETGLVNRGFWFYLPRPLVTCRVLGHKPVVDGTDGFRGRPGYRWVCCDRCGVRPEPQGSLDPAAWDSGDAVDLVGTLDGVMQPPGGWPERTEGVLGGQLVIGRKGGCGISAKVGNAGSEHTLAGHVAVPFLGALYLHTERFGTWLQRRLVPEGYESRVTEASVYDRHLSWRLWVLRDSGSRQGWRAGYVKIDPRDILLGEKRYSYETVGEPATVTVTLPEGDSYPVTVKLRRQSFGRPGGRKKLAWTADCRHDPGIPHRDGWKDGLVGWAVPVSDDAVEAGRWAQEAAAACVVKVTGLRIRYGWKPPVPAA